MGVITAKFYLKISYSLITKYCRSATFIIKCYKKFDKFIVYLINGNLLFLAGITSFLAAVRIEDMDWIPAWQMSHAFRFVMTNVGGGVNLGRGGIAYRPEEKCRKILQSVNAMKRLWFLRPVNQWFICNGTNFAPFVV